MTRICRWAAVLFTLLWCLALALMLVGTFGLFGQPRDPLGGVFLLPMGLPWNLFLDGIPEPLLAWAGAAAPGINLAIIALLCRLRHGSDQTG